MKYRKITCPDDKAEGNCYGVPYNTEIAGSEGVSIHFWFGDRVPDIDTVKKLKAQASWHRDIVAVTYSGGEPIGYWAQEDMDYH